MKYFFGLIIVVFLCMSCKTVEPIVIIEDPLVLQDISPLPRAVVIEIEEEFEPVYSIMRIIEVSEENGVQKYFLVRIGEDRTGIEVGVTENIAEDDGFAKIIGKYRIVEVFSDFFRCEIQELDYKIGQNAFVRVKIGEQLKVSP